MMQADWFASEDAICQFSGHSKMHREEGDSNAQVLLAR